MKTSGACILAGLLLAGGCARSVPPDGSGTIEATELRVAAETGGRLLRLPVEEGDRLQGGAVVAEIDPTGATLRRDEAQAALDQTQAALDLAVAGSRDEDIERARQQVREAAAASGMATQDLARIETVYAGGSATAKQLDDARGLAERALAAEGAAEQNLRRLLQGSRCEEIRMARSTVELARARLGQAEKTLADCTVRAPTNGTVTVKAAEAGEVIAAGTPLFTMAVMDPVWLAIYVPEPQLAGVRLGQAVRVQVDGRAAAITGTVSYLSPEAEFTPRNVQTADERAKLVYRVKVTLANPDGTFKPGLPADAWFIRP